MGGGVKLKLEVYLSFRGKRTWRGEEVVPPGTTAAGLLSLLGVTEPELSVLVNGRNVAEETVLENGDEVAILRQAEGG